MRQFVFSIRACGVEMCIRDRGYDKDSLNQTFVGKNSKEIGMELNSLENAIGAINHRMSRTLRESFKGAVSKDYER